MNSKQLCRYLRTKKMFIPALTQPANDSTLHEIDHSPHCWCNRTLTETGPDDRQVNLQTCKSGRSCFEE